MTRLLRLISLIFLLSFSLNACSGSAPVFTPSLTPDAIPTSTGTFIATTAVPDLSTPTPEPTPTPEAEVKMTLEDWKKVFSGPYVGDDGKNYDLEGLWCINREVGTIRPLEPCS